MPTHVAVSVRHFHIGFIAQAFESIQRVPTFHLLRRGITSNSWRRFRSKAKKSIQLAQELLRTSRELNSRWHIVKQPEGVVPFTALIKRRVLEKARLAVECTLPEFSVFRHARK